MEIKNGDVNIIIDDSEPIILSDADIVIFDYNINITFPTCGDIYNSTIYMNYLTQNTAHIDVIVNDISISMSYTEIPLFTGNVNEMVITLMSPIKIEVDKTVIRNYKINNLLKKINGKESV